VLPGDELVPNPTTQTTMAVTIRATPDQVYPWLLQLGVDRGGMYSYDWLENLFGLNVHTIDHIVPGLQNVKPGDFFRFTPKDFALPNGPGLYVTELNPPQILLGCFGLSSFQPTPCTQTWQFVLTAQGDGTTRLVLRSRTDAGSAFSAQMSKLFDTIALTMQRGMLLGFRDRIQAAKGIQFMTGSKR
jgi:hypothetical protein